MLAIEMGSKNHEYVPLDLLLKIANVKCNISTVLKDLVKQAFVKVPQHTAHFGYALTHTGYDNLALHALSKEGVLQGMGVKIGVGKEADVYTGVAPNGQVVCVKIHRLGRTSFRTVKMNRDYHMHRKHTSWMYLSRLSAEREFAHMQSIYQSIPTPVPISQNRHIVVMEYLENYTALSKIPNPLSVLPKDLKNVLVAILDALYSFGYAHGDFNEFNIMIRKDFKQVKIIDFPQMVTTEHSKAKEYYKRDMMCIDKFFTPHVSL